MSNTLANKKVLLIGLDGATWDLIKPWAARGILPTFKKLLQKGVYGDLESTIPPATVPAWISFATGTNPGKHECYYFGMPRGSLDDLRPITSRDIHGKTFYEILEESGRNCTLINLPGSYPPRIKGTVITSMLTQGDNFVFPARIVDEIPELRRYRILPDYSLLVKGKIEDFITDTRNWERDRFECARKLFARQWDFFFFLFSGTDLVQHYIYDKLVSGETDEGSTAIKLYKDIDQYLAWFVENAPKDTDILIMSDHGFAVYKKTFHVNQWLKRKGYLELEPKTKPQIPQLKSVQATEKARAEGTSVKLPNFLLNHLDLLAPLFPLYRKLSKILNIEIRTNVLRPKVSQSVVCSPEPLAIYINDKRRFIDGKADAEQYEKLKTTLIGELKEIKDAETGQSIVNNAWRKEEIYAGPLIDAAPDILLMSDEFLIHNMIHSSKLFTKSILNGHSMNGILLAYGPSIKDGAKIRGARIYDLTPTILHMFGLPVPDDMDGGVLKEFFDEGSEVAQREIRYRHVDTEEMRVKDKIRRLKELGRL